MVLKRVMDQTREKHSDSEVAIVHCPEDNSLWLIEGGQRRKIVGDKKKIEALNAMHTVGITKEDLGKIDAGPEL